ncbi:MAG: hypothetical protein KA069_01010 [Candidatus Saccharimonas sp.]|nr:hypothetical protein [Candidatus Saccharimonas sp.]
MAQPTSTLTLGDPSLNLQVTTQLTEVTVFPESQLGGDYDRARITTSFVVINSSPIPQSVEFLVPYISPAFSASIAIVSRGAEAYKQRRDDINPLKGGNLERIKPYLAKLQTPPEQYDTPKELKEQAKLFRSGTINVPAGTSTIEISLCVVIAPLDINGIKTFSLRAYAPLPGLGTMAATTTKLSVSARFKGADLGNGTIVTQKFPVAPVVSNPYGDVASTLDGSPLPQQPHGDDQIFWWKFRYDPYIDFTYNY